MNISTKLFPGKALKMGKMYKDLRMGSQVSDPCSF